MPRGLREHRDVSIIERVLNHIRRAHGDTVESVELRLAYGPKGVSAAHVLASQGKIERVRLGVYRARPQGDVVT